MQCFAIIDYHNGGFSETVNSRAGLGQ